MKPNLSIRVFAALPLFLICMTQALAVDLDSANAEYKAMVKGKDKVNKALELSLLCRLDNQLMASGDFADEALVMATELGDTAGMASAYLNKGMYAFRSLLPYDQISVHLLKSLDLYEYLNDSLQRSWLLMQLGLIDYSIGDMNEAAKNFELSIAVNPIKNDNLYTSRYLLGLSYSEIGEFDKAIDLLTSSLTDYAKGDPVRELFVKMFLGKLKYNQGHYQESVDYLEQAISEFPDPEDSASLASAHAYLSQGYLMLGELDKAIEKGMYTLKHWDRGSGISYWLAASTSLHQALAQQGRMSEAYLILKEMTQMEDSIGGAHVLERIANQRAKYLYEKELIKEKAKQDLAYQVQLTRQHHLRDLGLGSGILALLLAAGFFSRWRYVKKTNRELEEEKSKSDNLLLNILPAEIASELKAKGRADAQDFEQISILFTDFKEFTQLSEQLTAKELVGEINHCFEAFDHICEKYNVEKIKTIGDSYMAASGLPIPYEASSKNIVLAALEMADFMIRRKQEREKEGLVSFEMRAGIHTGNVVAGIVGVKKFQYDIWGDTVNTASRMESNCDEGKVNISQNTYELIKEDVAFEFESRGKIEAKGKGAVAMWYVQLRSGSDRSGG